MFIVYVLMKLTIEKINIILVENVLVLATRFIYC